MADHDLSEYRNDTYVGGPFLIMWFEAGDSLIKTGYIVGYDSGDAAEVTICATNGAPFGVAGKIADHDLNTVVSAGDSLPVYLLGVGSLMYLCQDGDSTVDGIRGSWCMRSDATAGKFEIWAYVDAAADTDTLSAIVGRQMEDHAFGGDEDWVKVLTSH